MHGFCHVELPTLDLDKARDFYGKLFGWQGMPIPGMNYFAFSPGEGAVGGGIQKVDKISQTPGVCNYVEVKDINEMLKKAESLGGKIVQSKQVLPNPDWGATGILETFDGYKLGLWSKA